MSGFGRLLSTYTPRLFYFLSAFSPLFAILGIEAFSGKNYVVASIYVFVFLFSIAAVLFYISDLKEDDPIIITPEVVKSRDSDVYQFLVAYLIPFIGLDTSKTWETVAFLLLLGLVGLAYIRTETPYINPILMIAGYHFYEIEIGRDQEPRSIRTCGLISKEEDIRPGRSMFTQRRSQFVYVHQNRKNHNTPIGS